MHLCAGRLRVNRRSYNEQLSAHMMASLLAFAQLSEHYRSWVAAHLFLLQATGKLPFRNSAGC